MKHAVVSREDWLAARRQFLAKEKEFTNARDRLSEERRALPWVKVATAYTFEGRNGRESFAQLFEERSQLLVYHFMFGPEWTEGCKSCSFWADSFNGVVEHLKHRDVMMLAISRAPYETLKAFQRRMGWTFKWVSSFGNDFNRDFNVSFTAEELHKPVFYNFERRKFPADEAPGLSAFYKDESGAIFHTYSCYARGLDAINGAYQLLDLAPKGRDEESLPYTMSWVRHRDKYGT